MCSGGLTKIASQAPSIVRASVFKNFVDGFSTSVVCNRQLHEMCHHKAACFVIAKQHTLSKYLRFVSPSTLALLTSSTCELSPASHVLSHSKLCPGPSKHLKVAVQRCCELQRRVPCVEHLEVCAQRLAVQRH